jgi:predicted DNA-binding transcriptional regulator YafY
VAFYGDAQEFRIFGLERIQNIRQLPDRVFLRKQTDFEDFFKHSVGITTTRDEPTDIVVAFSEQQSKYIATQPMHDSQALIDEVDGRLSWKFTIIPTFEFTAQLLGWGSEVEVLEPDWYRKEFIEILNRTKENYAD